MPQSRPFQYRPWQWVAMAVVAAASLATIAYSLAQLATGHSNAPSQPPDPLRFPSEAATQPSSPLAHWLSPGQQATNRPTPPNLLAGPQNRHPLAHEPARLPAPPGGHHLGRFRQTAGTFNEAVSLWRVADQPSQAVVAHYQQAARAKGFQPISTASATQPREPGRLLLFTHKTHGSLSRGQRADPKSAGLLRVSLRKSDAGIHVTLWLRYPSASRAGSAGQRSQPAR
jgi:hypothetical protein